MHRPAEDNALTTVYLTLLRACEFVQRHQNVSQSFDEPTRRRLIGNRLGELDRFLNVITDEAALRVAPIYHDCRAFARLHNTPNKVRVVRAMMGLPSPDHETLRAAGRIRDRLRHGSGGADLTGPALLSMCLLYRSTADDLLKEVSERAPQSH